MTAEDDGSGGSVRKLSEDDRRWRFDVLQSRFWRAGGGHVYQRLQLRLLGSIVGLCMLERKKLNFRFKFNTHVKEIT